MRITKNINDNWKYTKGDVNELNSNDTHNNWRNVSLPHTWNAIDGTDGSNYYRGVGWYVKELTFSPEDEERKHFIEFLGSNSVTEVFVNNKRVGMHKGGYSIFRFDITDYLNFDSKNLISVKVDNAEYEDIYPLRADFTFFGGIYRDVNIISVEPIHIDLEDYGSSGVYIEQSNVNAQEALLNIKTKLTNNNSVKEKVRLSIEILDQQNNLVNYQLVDAITNTGSNVVQASLNIENLVLWNGKENPYMYTLNVSVQKHNDTLDELKIPFGVRDYHVDAEQGLVLNGKSLRLNGVSRHQDRSNKGWAISKTDQEEDMELIKEIGATSIRLAHYQHDQYFYDLCDKEGMIVWAEIPFITEVSRAENPEENAEQQLIELIRQNYNHPSIFFWGIQNEIQIDHASEEKARKIVKELNELAKHEDATRLTTMANVLTVDDTDEYNYITDIIGYNKYYGWYMGKTEDFAEWIDQYHEINPNTPLAISEYGAEGIIEYHSSDPKVKDYTEEYHTLFHETVWEIFAERKFLWATYVWNMFDFGANIRDEGGVKGRNNKGLITYDRKIKKDAFYMYKAHWSQEPFVHITGKRYIQRSGETTTVKVYSNCKDISLFINGELFKSSTTDNNKVIFEGVPLTDEIINIQVQANADEKAVIDQVYFYKVEKEPDYYKAPVENEGENVKNWFEKPEIDEDAELVDVVITDDVYSSRDTIEVLMTNEETRQRMLEVVGDLSKTPMYGMIKNMKIDTIMKMDQDSQLFNEVRINKLNQKLTKIKK